MHQRKYFPFQELRTQESALSSFDQDEMNENEYPALKDTVSFPLYNSALAQTSSFVSRESRRPSMEVVAKKDDSWMCMLKELFVSRPVFPVVDDFNMPENMIISWTESDDDSDLSTVPGLHDYTDPFDHDESEEDTFCVEAVLQRTATTDSLSTKGEESVVVTFSADWRSR